MPFAPVECRVSPCWALILSQIAGRESDKTTRVTTGVVVLIIAVVAWAAAFGTLAGVIWRNRGGNATDGFLIGALFGVFGLAFCALATPKRHDQRTVDPAIDDRSDPAGARNPSLNANPGSPCLGTTAASERDGLPSASAS